MSLHIGNLDGTNATTNEGPSHASFALPLLELAPKTWQEARTAAAGLQRSGLCRSWMLGSLLEGMRMGFLTLQSLKRCGPAILPDVVGPGSVFRWPDPPLAPVWIRCVLGQICIASCRRAGCAGSSCWVSMVKRVFGRGHCGSNSWRGRAVTLVATLHDYCKL